MRIKEVRSFLNRYLRAIIILQRAYPQVKRQNYMSCDVERQPFTYFRQPANPLQLFVHIRISRNGDAKKRLGITPTITFVN